MRRILITCIISLTCTVALAQKPDQLLARVHYIYVNQNDTLKNGKTRQENMMLFVGKNASVYSSYDKLKHEIAEDQKYRNKAMNTINNGKPVAIIMDISGSEWMSSTSYLYFIKEGKFFTKETIALQSYLIEEKAPELNWTITKDTASFSGLSCKKAICNFEGKNWIAWYAPSLPFQSGPWKLNGLPGLIIDAYNDKKEVQFQFAGFENAKEGDFTRVDDVTKRPDARPGQYNPLDQLIGIEVGAAYFENTIKLPFNAIPTDKKQFEKLKSAFLKDPKGFIRTQSRY